MKLYTKKGDSGITGILGRDKVKKDDMRIEAYGTIDELNSVIGMLIHHVNDEFHHHLRLIQSTLFEIGTELASTEIKNIIKEEDTKVIENLIDNASERSDPLKSFILPGGSIGGSWFHIARTVCRRAERRVVSLDNEVELNNLIVPYINRLSDLFFALARLENKLNGVEDIPWEARK